MTRETGAVLLDTEMVESQMPIAEPHERTFGSEQLYVDIDVDSLIMVKQIRNRKNKRFHELKDSVRDQGLDNPINVARLTADELQDYLAFVNETWESNYDIAMFERHRQVDGKYNLVVAGHNRAKACQELAAEAREARNEPTATYKIRSKLLQDTSVGGIVSKQYAENLHDGVTTEQEAMSIVELYRWGLGEKWSSSEEFRETNGAGLSKQNFEDAMAFFALPKQLQQAVFARLLPYRAGVELGKLMPLLYEDKLFASGVTDIAALQELERHAVEHEIGQATHDQAMVYAIQISKNPGTRNNASAARRLLEAARTGIEARIAEARQAGPAAAAEPDSLFETELEMVAPATEARRQRELANRERARALREAALAPHQTSTELALLYGTPELLEELAADVTHANEHLHRNLTRMAGRIGAQAIFFDDEELAG